MSFGSVVLTGTVETPDGNPVPFAVVNALLSANITDGVTQIIASPISAIADKHGDFSLTVLPNDYPSITPDGTYYEIVITSFGQTLANFNTIVLTADAPTVDLFSLPVINADNLPAVTYGIESLTLGSGLTNSGTEHEPILSVTPDTFDAYGVAAAAQAAAEAASLPLAGGTMAAAIAMGVHKITGLANGSASSDAAAFGQIPTSASSIGGVLAANNGSDFIDAGIVRANIHEPTLTPAAAVATTNVALSGLQTVDGYQLSNAEPGAAFDGTTGYITGTASSQLGSAFQNHDFTVAAWIKPGTSQNYWMPFCYGLNAPGEFLLLEITAAGIIIQRGASISYGVNHTFTAGQWYLIGASYVNATNTVTIYVNGSSVGSGNISTVDVPSASEFSIAAAPTVFGAAYYFDGTMSEVGVVASALSGANWSALYSVASTAGAYDPAFAAFSPVAWWKLADAPGSMAVADASGNASVGAVTGSVVFGSAGAVAGTSSDLVLCTDQTVSSQNGLWQVAAGSWTRPTEFASGIAVHGRTCSIMNGTTYGSTSWVLKAPTQGVIVDTSPQSWTNQPGAVPSIFGRSGPVTAQTGDYSVSQITGAVPYGVSGNVVGGFTAMELPVKGSTPTIPAGNYYTVASATGTTITVAGAPWAVNQWKLFPVTITAGTGLSTKTIAYVASNTANTLTLTGSTLTTPDNTSTILIGFDVNYNAIVAAMMAFQTKAGAGYGGKFVVPGNGYTLPYGFPPCFFAEQIYGQGSTFNIPSSYTLPFPAFRALGPGWGIFDVSLTGPGGISVGNPGTSRIRAIQGANTLEMKNISISEFFIGVSHIGDHVRLHDCAVQNNYYGYVYENFAFNSYDGGNNDMINVNLSSNYFAGIVSSDRSPATFNYRGAASHMGASLYAVIAVDYIDEQTGFPANMNFSTLSATSNTITVGPSGTPIVFQNNLAGRAVYIVSGTGSGQARIVSSCSGAAITVSTNWSTTPDSTSVFTLAFAVSSATSTTATFSGVTFDNVSFPNGQMTNLGALVIAGTGASVSVRGISATGVNSITVGSWGTTPDNTSIIQFVRTAVAYNTCQIGPEVAAEAPAAAVFMEFSASVYNASFEGCSFELAQDMAHNGAVPGFPSGYAWDFNSASASLINGFLSIEGTATNFNGIVRSRLASTEVTTTSNPDAIANSASMGVPFDGSSNSDGITVLDVWGGFSGVSKKLAGTVAQGEPLERSTVLANTVQKFVGSGGLVIAAGLSTVAAKQITVTGKLGWPAAYVNGWTLAITAGTGMGQSVTLDNTSTGDILHWTTGTFTPDATSVFLLTNPAPGAFYGIAGTTQTGGVVVAIREIKSPSSGFQALVGNISNSGYRLTPTGATPGYFNATSVAASGSVDGYAIAFNNNVPELIGIELK